MAEDVVKFSNATFVSNEIMNATSEIISSLQDEDNTFYLSSVFQLKKTNLREWWEIALYIFMWMFISYNILFAGAAVTASIFMRRHTYLLLFVVPMFAMCLIGPVTVGAITSMSLALALSSSNQPVMPSDTTNTETQDRDALLFLKDATEADTKMTSEFCNEFEMSRSETVVKDMKEQPVTTCDRLSLEFHGMKIMKTPVSKVIGNSGLANAKYNSPLGSRTVRSSSSVRSGLRRARVSPQSSPNNTDVVKTPDDHENYDVKLNKPQDYKTNNFNGKSCKWDYDYLNNISKGLIIYPLIYVSPAGTISAILSHDLIIEMSVDRSLRIVHHDHFVAFINSSGSSSALLHHRAKIVHTKDTIFSKFTSTTDKIAVLDSDGVLFTMSHLSEAFLMNSFIRGVSAIPVDKLDFPSSMKNDFTLKMFYADAQTGNQFMILCNEIVDQAMHQRKPDGTLIMHVNGLSIKSQPSGYISIDNKARHFSYTPGCETINLRTSHADIGLQTNEKAFVKSGTKRVHVSKSGMVVSDGNSVTSMDQFGQILSGASILRR